MNRQRDLILLPTGLMLTQPNTSADVVLFFLSRLCFVCIDPAIASIHSDPQHTYHVTV
jgi:hypothetical protein